MGVNENRENWIELNLWRKEVREVIFYLATKYKYSMTARNYIHLDVGNFSVNGR